MQYIQPQSQLTQQISSQVPFSFQTQQPQYLQQAPQSALSSSVMSGLSTSPIGYGIRLIKMSIITLFIINIILYILIMAFSSTYVLWKVLIGIVLAVNLIGFTAFLYGLSMLPI